MKQRMAFFCRQVSWLLVVILSLPLANLFAGIKVGVAEVVITPPNPVGIPMAGYDRGKNTSTGVHDDLYTRSIVVQGEDGTSVAMLSLALVNMSEEVMDSIRSGVERETGIPFKNVIVSATHTHSGPVVGAIDDEYVKFLIRQSVSSAASAWQKRTPGKIGVGSMSVFGLAMNDRRMEFGGIPADPEAAVIKVEDLYGQLMGVFFNFGCHPSVLDLSNLLFTEDWPYFAIKGIKEALGSDVVVGYFQAAQGDAKVGYNAELSAVGAYMQDLRTFEFAAQKGNIMTEAVLKLLPSIVTTDDAPVRVSYDKFAVPRRTTFPYTPAEAQAWQDKARKTLEEKEKLVLLYPENKSEAEQLRQASLKAVAEGKTYDYIGPRTLDHYKVDLWLATQAVSQSKLIEEFAKNPKPFMMPMQALRLGENVFVTFPAEVFTEIGLSVKALSPYPNTFIFGVAGGYRGYIATVAEFIEGGYAVNGSPYAPHAEQVIIDASIELINRVKD